MSARRWPTAEERFWSKVDKNGPTLPHMDSPCWVWTGKLRKGYGRLTTEGVTIQAHRYSLVVSGVDIPDGLEACHRCDHRACVRPDHLFLGTRRENAQDMSRKGRGTSGDKHSAKVHQECIVRGESQPHAKLTDATVRDIRSGAAKGVSQRALARQHGVTQSIISRVLLRKSWSHVA